jgi:hypothetical protein
MRLDHERWVLSGSAVLMPQTVLLIDVVGVQIAASQSPHRFDLSAQALYVFIPKNRINAGEKMHTVFRDTSIGIFFLVLAGSIALGGQKIVNVWTDTTTKRIENQTTMINTLDNAMSGALTEIQSIRESNDAQFAELKKNAEMTSRFIEEISILAGARFFEDARVLSPATADELAREAIQNIRDNHSGRLGKILEAVNDSYLRDRN